MSELPLRESPATEPADLVEALWASSGGPPELKSVLADHPQWSARELRDALMVDQQFRWRTSQPWSAEQYLAVLPPAAADDALTLDLIYGECRGRTHSGNPPDLAELVRRFPHLRQRLERQLEIASWFADADGGDSPPGEEDSTDDTDATTIRFGDYDLCEEIARGGMGVIYRARHRKLKRTVALKMIRPERLMRAADVRRFKNETRIIARLDHPNIIPILNVGQVDGIHFFTMRMVQGRDLESRRTEFLSDVRRAARLVWAVAAAIHHAHQHGVLHRDLKPSNVLVDDSGVPYVVDFGLARQGTESHGLTAPDEFLGTPAYAAPEQLQKGSQPLTVAADVYGLGAILYVLITGQPPFTGPNLFEIWHHIRESEPQHPRALNARVDPDLAAICLKALEKNPAARYPSAVALAEDLEHYLAREPVAARPVGWWQRRWRRLRKHPTRAALALAVSAATIGLLMTIAVQSIQLHEEMRKTRGARMEADAHHKAMELAQAEAERLRDEATADRSLARQALYVADIRLADAARQTGDSMQLAQLLDRQFPRPGQEDVRGFEWFVLNRLCRPPSIRLKTDSAPLGCVVYSRNGQWIAAAGEGGRIQVFDAQTHAEKSAWSTQHRIVRDLAFTADGSHLASAGDDGNVRLHPLEAAAAENGNGSDQDIRRLSHFRELRISPHPVWQVEFLPDGKTLATRAEDGVIRIVRSEDGAEQGRIESPDEKINAMALAPDGTWLVSGGEDGGIGIWDVATCRCLHRFAKDNRYQIKVVALSGDGQRLATGGTDKQVQIWDVSEPATPRLLLRGNHYDRLQALAFSADSQALAACDKSGSLRLWPVPAAGESVVDSPPARVWQAHDGRANSVAFHPTKNELASAGQESHVAIWDLAARVEPRTLDEPGGLNAHERTLAFTPDGRYVAVPGQAGVRLWDVQTGKLDRTLGDPASPADHVAISLDGRLLVTARKATATVELWDLGSELRSARGSAPAGTPSRSARVSDPAGTPSGSARVSDPVGTADRRSPENQETVGHRTGSVQRPAAAPIIAPRWQITNQPCGRLVFSPDSTWVAVISYDRDEVAIYAAATGQIQQRIPATQCRAAAFSPDGRWLAFTVQDNVILWDWPRRRQVQVLSGHISTVTSAAFSPDSRTLATAGNDRRIKLWQPASGQLIHTMTGSTGYVRDIAFADNNRLISVGDSGNLRVWHVTLGQLLCSLQPDRGSIQVKAHDGCLAKWNFS